ncbi:S-layer homology domain-containing protein [Paenibacillus sp. 1781tsa1]|uniref:S-layer homology domain-containing protein n=1 Tax=Paenibacillus sp. 1781tsa1 TaxID=2953810 RepID=UPI0020A05E7F|nr:S-layer homology domain-containing protein [Paenibacillus sp. 1781tsa1]MCP1186960.1 S-layer homology domain-containing protein [Paenibacillus sp. 1781tsa1]
MKKILSVALSTAMAFSMFASVAFGDTAVTPQQQFDALKAKGIFNGYPDGTAGLDKEMTRAEFAKVITKLLGLKEITGTLSYNDKNYTAKNWAVPYIEAVTAAGIMEGKNVEKKIFDFNGKVTVAEMATILTRALDLEIPTETNNNAAAWAKGYVQAAINAGLIDANANFSGNASRELLVGAAYSIDQAQSLKVESYTVTEAGKVVEFKISDGETVKVTLDKALEANKETEVKFTYKDKEFTEKVTYVVTAATKVQSVSANNYKEITVAFDGEVQEASATNVKNYTIDGFSFDSATLSADKKTVTLLLDQDAADTLDRQKEYTIAVNVKNANETKTFDDKVKFTPVDTTIPTVESVTGLGTKAFKVVFSEPVKQSTVNTTSNFRINGNAVSGSVKYSYPNTAIITTDLPVGNHKLTVSNVEDFAGFKIASDEKDFTVAEDTTAPEVVSVKTTDLTEVEVKFNESIKSVGTVYHTTSGYTASSVTIKDDTVKLVFDQKLSLSENTVYFQNVTDYSNNSANREVKVTPVLDTQRPAVVGVKTELTNNDSAHKFTFEFSKNVIGDDARKPSNYTIKDSAGKVVVGKGLDSNGHPAVTVSYDTTTKKASFTLLGKLDAGKYTIEVAGVRDTASIANTMLPYTTVVDVSNAVKPVVTSTWVEESQAGTKYDAVIYVQFSKAMAVSGAGDVTQVNKYNYATNFDANTNAGTFRPIPSDSKVELVNAETVRITLPRSDNPISGNTLGLRIATVADTNGNYAGSDYLVYTQVKPKVDLKVVAEKAEATALDTLKVTFSSTLSSVDANDFTVNGNTVTVTDTTVVDGKTVATLKLNTKFVADLTGATFVIRPNPTSQNAFGTVIDANAPTLADKIAPKVAEDSVLTVAKATVAGQTNVFSATVEFNEKLKVQSSPAAFTVRVEGKDVTVLGAEADANGNLVVLFNGVEGNKITDKQLVEVFLKPFNTDAKVVTDLKDNAAESFTKAVNVNLTVDPTALTY